MVQWRGTAQDGNRERLWLPFPKDPILHTAEFRWKSYKEVEPTASSQQHPPAAPKPKLTARANRVKRQWESRQDMRTFVTSHLEAALPFWCTLASPILIKVHRHQPNSCPLHVLLTSFTLCFLS